MTRRIVLQEKNGGESVGEDTRETVRQMVNSLLSIFCYHLAFSCMKYICVDIDFFVDVACL